MLGASLLVAPVVEPGQAERVVYLPRGTDWVDWWSDETSRGGETADCPAPWDKPVMFVRAGSVIPLNIVKTFDEFSGTTGVLGGKFSYNAFNNSGTIETVVTGTQPVFGYYTSPSTHWINVGRNVGCLIDCTWQAEGIPVGVSIFTTPPWTTDIFSITDIFNALSTSFITAFPYINVSSDGVFDGDIYAVTDVYTLNDVYMCSSTVAGWQRYRAGFYVGQGFAFQMFLESFDVNTIAAVSAFSYTVHIPTRIDHYIGKSILAAGTTITFQPDGSASTAAFNGGPGGGPASPGLPTWQASITNEVAGDLLSVSGLSLSQATVSITNAGVGVGRTVNIEFAGY